MKRPARRVAPLCALLASTALAAPALAQGTGASVFQAVDGNGVDLVDGSFNFSLVEGSIGAGDSALTISRSYGRAGWTNGLPGRLHRTLSTSNNRISLGFDNRAEHFDLVNGEWVPQKRDGATLTGSGSSYTYRTADGTTVTYAAAGRTAPLQIPGSGGIQYCVGDGEGECELVPVSVTRPNGRQLNLHWTVATLCSQAETGGGDPGDPNPTIPPTGGTGGESCNWFPRLVSIVNESDYLAKFRYAEDSYTTAGPAPGWFRRTSAQLVNTAIEACDPDAVSCNLSQSWPTVAYAEPAAGVTQITTPGSHLWVISEAAGSVTIQSPGSSSPNVTVARSNGIVSSVTADGVTTNYARSVSGTTATMIVTNALNQATTVVSDLNVGRPTLVTDPLAHAVSMQYDSHGRLTRTTAPEGNYTQNSYDARGNLTQVQQVAVPGSGDATITASASYDATCTNGITCNLPNSTTDARGNTTAYTYNQTHGGVLTVTGPAVTIGGASVQPQVRTTYSTVDGLQLPTQVSMCQTSANCIGTADEVRSSVVYGTNNQPVSTSAGNGAGTLTATSSVTYDSVGNVLTADGPLAGSADTIRFRYDAARRRIGTVSADPDGAGALPNRATRITYRPDGQVSKSETGVVNSQSDADWAQMAVIEQVDIGYDGNSRPVLQSMAANGTMHSVVQTGYDALGRVDCVAQRMNPTTWGALPASACTLAAQGAYGPDRIGRTFRNAAGRTTEVRTAVGTPLEASIRTNTYSTNGQILTATDGENNRTSYQYDGHGRLRRTYFPLAAQGSNASNSGDYEELGYDASSNVTGRRNRAGETALYTFDALGRMTVKDLPGTEPDVVYSYDLLGRLLSANQPAHQLSFTYDALGRQLSQTNPMGTIGSTYDLAGRRTRITYPGGVYFVDQDYLVTGEMAAIRENGATSGLGVIATFGYDLLGRRTSLMRGNGVVTNYAYDPASRLQTLSNDLAGTSNDLSLGFAYNPAGQIVSNTRNNDLYSYTGAAAGTINSTANGLNQLATHNGGAPTYDARGNIASEGGRTFTYSSENLFTGHTVTYNGIARTLAFTYDPLMRLHYQTTSGLNSRTFAMDGHNAIVTYIATPDRWLRAVYGPGENEVLYQLDHLNRRTWFAADERGSIVASTDAAGATGLITTYDEYGRTSALTYQNAYTGALVLGVSGLNYMRARVYDPTLGRFLQTDPIGYGDGMNMYGYVGGDPVNSTDPTGLLESCNSAMTRIRSCMSEGEAAQAAVGFTNQHFGDGSAADKAEFAAAVASYLLYRSDIGDVSRVASSLQDRAALDSILNTRFDTTGAGLSAFPSLALGVSNPQVTQAPTWVELGRMTVPQGGSLTFRIPNVTVSGYQTIGVRYRFISQGDGEAIFTPTLGSVNLRFDYNESFWSSRGPTLTGSIGLWHSRIVNVPTGADRVSGYPSPISPGTEVIIYGRTR